MKSKVQSPKSKVAGRVSSDGCRVTSLGNLQPSTFNPQRGDHALTLPRSHAPTPQSAVALVITLILLAVITFMAVTFLVVSRGEKTSVGTAADQTAAKFAADAARENAIADILAPMLAW